MRKRLIHFLISMLLVLGGAWTSAGQTTNGRPCSHLEAAINLDYQRSPDSEREYELALRDSKLCPKVLLRVSQNRSKELRSREAVPLLERYLKLIPLVERKDYRETLRDWRKASLLKERVDATETPSLHDLLDLARLVQAYGANKTGDAMPYLRRTLDLYPDSVEAILFFAEITTGTNHASKEDLSALLDRAVQRQQFGHYRV